jgi:hypothetical protein
MSERLEAMTVRESNGKSYWTKIGVAFPAKQGEGYTVLLDAMPAPVEGQFKILLREPLPPREQTQSYGRQNARAELDDEVPGF